MRLSDEIWLQLIVILFMFMRYLSCARFCLSLLR
jgi:hypothetical protein